MSKAFPVTLVLVFFVLTGVRQTAIAAEPVVECGQFVQKFYNWTSPGENVNESKQPQRHHGSRSERETVRLFARADQGVTGRRGCGAEKSARDCRIRF